MSASGWSARFWRSVLAIVPLDFLIPLPSKIGAVVAGLGNPGKRVQLTRHNAGVLAAAALQGRLGGGRPFRRYRGSLVSAVRIGDRQVLIVIPRLPMNRNGEALAQIIGTRRIDPANVVVVHDDSGLEAGEVRLSQGGGGSSHHKGLESVVDALKSEAFVRVRIGTGPLGDKDHLENLLTQLDKDEGKSLVEGAVLASHAIELALSKGVRAAQNAFNTTGDRRASPRGLSTQSADFVPPFLPATIAATIAAYARRVLARLDAWSNLAMHALVRASRLTFLRHPRLIVVIGTFGKTTTRRVIASMLGLPTPWRGLHRGNNSRQGLALLALSIPPWRKYGVLEVGIAQPGRMGIYARSLRPQIVVMTCLGSEHHRAFASIEAKRDEKAVMVYAMGAAGVLVANGDDPHVRLVASRFKGRVIRYGLAPDNDIRASDVHIDFPHGTRFALQVGEFHRLVLTHLLGEDMVRAFLAAVGVAVAQSIDLETAIRTLERVTPTYARLQLARAANGAWLIRDEEKGLEETIESALAALQQVRGKRRIVVLGDVEEPVGAPSQLYARLGERLARAADYVVIVGGQFRKYASAATKAGMAREHLFDAGNDYRRAVDHLVQILTPDDVVLVKGRGRDRLQRVSLALMGRDVHCIRYPCDLVRERCDTCRFLGEKTARP